MKKVLIALLFVCSLVAGFTLIPAHSAAPIPTVVLEQAPGLSISFYEGLTTREYVKPDGTKATFDPVQWIEYLGHMGVSETRVFADFNWCWRADLKPPQGRFNASYAVLPFKFIKGATVAQSTWAFGGPVNQEYADRIQAMGEVARKYHMKIVICLFTQGPDFGSFYMTRMGYPPDHKAYYEQADFPAFQANGAWNRFLRHVEYVGRATVNYKDVYHYFEPFNEMSHYGSLVDEFRGVRQALNKAGRSDAKLQINGPWFSDLQSDPSDNARWIGRLAGSNALGFKISRFSFHGVFTPAGVHQLASEVRDWGLSTSQAGISTDGATPGFGFTQQDHQGHFNMRPYWDNSEANVRDVIQAHRRLLIACRQEGFAFCDLQSMVKWSLDADYSRQVVHRFDREMNRAARLVR